MSTQGIAVVGDRALAAVRSRRTAAGEYLRAAVDSVGPPARRAREFTDLFSAAGWVALAAGLVGVWLGATQGWVELAVLGVVALIALVGAVLLVLGRTAYVMRVELESARVRVGHEAIGRLVITNRSRRSLLPTRIELPVGRATASFDLPGLGHDEDHEEIFTLPTRRRGVIPIGPVVSVRTDPLYLLRRTQRWTERHELFVHPRTVLLDSGTAGFLRDVEGVTTNNLSSSDVAFHAIREYVPGDDRRAIHWKTTARTGRFMVRQFEETRRTHLLVLLSVHPDDYASPEDFENAVSCAGSLGLQALREERELSVATQAGLLRFATGPGLLDELCRVELDAAAGPLPRLAEVGVKGVPEASVIGLVTGNVPTPRDLRAAELALPLDASRFAIRCGDSAPARRSIGRLTVLDLSSVDELPRAVRSLR